MYGWLFTQRRWTLPLICIITFFARNKIIIPDIMESRNIVTAREMVYDGHWIIPTLNGELRLEKPPLPTWITAAVELVSPDNLFLLRSLAGIAALFLLFFFYRTAILFTRDKGFAFLSILRLFTSYNIILMGRTISWDIFCHAFMMGAIYFLTKGIMSLSPSKKSFCWAGLFMGLSFMSKGDRKSGG